MQQVELTNRRECLVKVGDLRQLIHVLSNVADDLRIIDALVTQPFPDHQKFAMRRVRGVVQSSGTTIEDAGRKVSFDELNFSVSIRFCVANPFPDL